MKSDDFDEESEIGMSCRLKFEYTPNYPEEPPLIEIEESKCLDDNDEETLNEFLKEQVVKQTCICDISYHLN